MEKVSITLYVEETTVEMAYQVLAIAIKKKFKHQIRPYFEIHTDNGLEVITSKELQNDLWRDKGGQYYDY